MSIALLILGALVALFVLFVVWRIYATHAGTRRTYLRLAAKIAPVNQALQEGRTPRQVDLDVFAADRTTRKVLYETLEAHDRLDLFPDAFRTQEALAEADLAAWLSHPNEMGAPPDEIELMDTAAAPGRDGQVYYVFRFRMRAPHWAAGDGWMAGVAGPYDLQGSLTTHGRGTFSRFEAYDSRPSEEHVLVTHRLVIERRAS
jgi:hypothetical protein